MNLVEREDHYRRLQLACQLFAQLPADPAESAKVMELLEELRLMALEAQPAPRLRVV